MILFRGPLHSQYEALEGLCGIQGEECNSVLLHRARKLIEYLTKNGDFQSLLLSTYLSVWGSYVSLHILAFSSFLSSALVNAVLLFEARS